MQECGAHSARGGARSGGPRRRGAADALVDVVRAAYVPNRVLAVAEEGEPLRRHALLVPLLRHKKARDGRATAYVCENRVCRFPTAEPDVLAKQLAVVEPLAAPPRGPDAP